MARKGRKPKSAEQKAKDAVDRTSPADYILERRKLFSFVQPPAKARLDGRNGEIDSEVCDAIGQFCVLGLLDGHGHDPVEMRDKGRFWGGHYAQLFKGSAMKVGSLEPRSRSTGNAQGMTGADLMFDRMDEPLPSFERQVLLSLIVDPIVGTYPSGEFPHWASALIAEGLRKRGRFVACGGFPTEYDRELLAATIRGLAVLVDGALPARWERAA